MAICNAANEVAVDAFLGRQIRFTDIPVVIEQALTQVSSVEPVSLAVVEAADTEARALATDVVAGLAGGLSLMSNA
jgi:1-deoxy-D-xylulose-5-phosphate reductoisomerase